MNKEQGTTPIDLPAEEDSRFRTDFEHLPIGMVRLGLDGRLRQVNPRLRQITGLRHEDLVGRHLAELVHPEERQSVRGQIARIALGELPGCMLEQRLGCRDGTTVWAKLSLGGQRGANGRTAGLIAAIDDVTVARHAQLALRESEERLRLALDVAEMDVFDYDPVTDRVHRHGRLGSTFGLSPDSTGEDLIALVHPGDRTGFRAALTGLSPERPACALEYRLRAPNGTWRRLFDQAIGRFDARGRLVQLLGVSTDVTQRRSTEAALAQERELLRQIIDHIPVMLCLFDPRVQRYKLNRHFATVLGWCSADANRGDFLARAYPDPAQRAQVLAFMRSPATEWREWCVTGRDGARVPCEWTKIRLSNGSLIGIGLDRRQRKANEARLARHAARQSLLLEVARALLQDGFDEAGLVQRVFDLVGAPLEADACLCYRSGPRDGELELVAACGVPPERQAAARCLAPGQTYCSVAAATARPHLAGAEDIARDAQGALARTLGLRACICHPLFAPDGQVIGTFALASSRRTDFAQDEVNFLQALCYFIALAWERIRSERELRCSEQRYRLALDAGKLGAWRRDPATGCLEMDARARTHFGFDEAAVPFSALVERVHPDDRPRLVAEIAAVNGAAPGEEARGIEYRVVHRDGSERWLAVEAKIFCEGEERDASCLCVGTVQDVSERRRADDALRRIASERSEAARRKDEFLATLAHELRNPLNPIRNAAQVLRQGGGDEARLRWSAEVIERQVVHLTHLIDDLLDVSRITLNKLGLRRQRIGLREVIEDALESVLPLIEAQGHTLTIDQPAQDVELEGDPVRLVQVLQNLLDNAAKYTPPGGRIDLAVREPGAWVEISVRDSGTGLAPGTLAHVFDMFYQGEREGTEVRSGLGIGLTLVQRLVQMHGGSIEAHSAGRGLGSEFVVRLPRVAPGVGPAPAPPAMQTRGETAAAPVRHRVLVVDDNLDSAESTALLLRLEGHEVHLAHDGLQAVQEAERLRPTLVLLDIGMPVLDGYEAARRIRASEWGLGLLLVAQTGWGQQDDIRRAREAGFDAHFTKPLDPDALMRFLAQKTPAAT